VRLQRQELKKARIEIIPMIDTIFFLLVFFMMSSLQMVQMSAHKVNLPVSSTAQGKAVEKIVVSVSKEGDYYVDRRKVRFADILPMLEERVRQDPRVVVVINCDKDQQVGEMQGVIDVAKQANPGTLMIATAPKDPMEVSRR
jgi:biopolymer transport protein ExbD